MSYLRATIDDVLNFTAIDFETANNSPASACSVGLVKVRGGRVVERASWFIRPPAGHGAFLEWNTRIHGIVESDVTHAKTWEQQYPDLVAFAEGDVLVAHNARFDMGVIAGGCAATGIDIAEHHSMCSLAVARKTYTLDSYRLPVAATAAGFSGFQHHDAAADAEACAAIVVHAAGFHGVPTVEALGAVTRVTINPVRARAEKPKATTPQPRLSRRPMVFSD
ncbi:exonuclease domain-containing protein [Curtobacterium sp. MCSS17_015]|uniref:exonuclease domain-containing protein n=1 Tax=Curtobacterium sp. MCSS17_015 TaxID=2175666 RepID=UPI000DA9EC48|nr:exonuclease domain-containing protein [Curtobacterium sp. MCSS17_015]WIB27232.1 exonuclease domain-containing protein [Curtobacterium sp. MCSS17_015]